MSERRETSWWWAVAAVMLAAGAGCSSLGSPLPGGAGGSARPFADVPPPPDCELGWSYVHQSGSYRYGTLIYVGKPSTEEVIEHYKLAMARENWSFIERIGTDETILRYSKARRAREHCDIIIREPDWRGRRCIVVTVTGSHGQ